MNIFYIATICAMNNVKDSDQDKLKNSLQDKYVYGKKFLFLLNQLSSDEEEEEKRIEIDLNKNQKEKINTEETSKKK